MPRTSSLISLKAVQVRQPPDFVLWQPVLHNVALFFDGSGMAKKEHISETPATQLLRKHGITFSEHPYEYEEHGPQFERLEECNPASSIFMVSEARTSF